MTQGNFLILQECFVHFKELKRKDCSKRTAVPPESCFQRRLIKKHPAPDIIRGGIHKYIMYSTVPPWLRTSPPLIACTITGIPGLPFPTVSSEVVSHPAVLQSLLTNRPLSWNLTQCACLHQSHFHTEYSTILPLCQSRNRQKGGFGFTIIYTGKDFQ